MEKKSKKIQEYLKQSFELYSYFKNGLSEIMPLAPLHIYIEPTNICNLNCLHCARWAIKRKLQHMKLPVFTEAISQIKKAGWNPKITLTGQGEPLLHKEIVDFVKLVKQNGLFVSIICNGTVLTEELGLRLLKAGLDRMQFSFDSVDKEIYESVRRGSNYEKTLKNILDFAELNEKMGHSCYVSISSVQSKKVAEQKEEFVKFWEKYPIDNVFLAPLSNLQGKSNLKDQAKKHGARQLCILPWLSMSIKTDGSIVGCAHDYNDSYVLSKVGDSDIKEVWNGEKIKFLRGSLLKNEFEFFKKIGHNCEECNNYCIGYGLDDYLEDYFLRLEKNLEPFFTGSKK